MRTFIDGIDRCVRASMRSSFIDACIDAFIVHRCVHRCFHRSMASIDTERPFRSISPIIIIIHATVGDSRDVDTRGES